MSDEPKKNIEKEVPPKKKHAAQKAKLEEKISVLEKEVLEWKNKFMRVHADMDNAKKQNAKDQQYYIKYRAVPFIEKLLPSLDIFGQVLRNEPEDEVLRNYLTGFKFVYSHIVEALESEGLKEIVVNVGDKFDEQTMYALETEYRDDVAANTILSVRNNSFMFLDRLIRPAQVIVATDIKESEQKDEENKENNVDPSTMN